MLRKRRSFATAPIKVVVLVVGASPRFLERFRIASAPRKAEILDVDLERAQAVASARIPRTLLVPAEVYARGAAVLDGIAEDVCARIVEVPSEDVSEAELEHLVQQAVRWG